MAISDTNNPYRGAWIRALEGARAPARGLPRATHDNDADRDHTPTMFTPQST